LIKVDQAAFTVQSLKKDRLINKLNQQFHLQTQKKAQDVADLVFN